MKGARDQAKMGKKRKKQGKSSTKGKGTSSLAAQLAQVKLGPPPDVIQAPPEAVQPEDLSDDIDMEEELRDVQEELRDVHSRRGRAQQIELDDAAMLALWEAEDDAPKVPAPRVAARVTPASGAGELERLRKEIRQLQRDNQQMAEQLSSFGSLEAKTAQAREAQRAAERAAQEARAASEAAQEAAKLHKLQALAERDEAREELSVLQRSFGSLTQAMARRGIPGDLQAQAFSAIASTHASSFFPMLTAPLEQVSGFLDSHIAMSCDDALCREELGQSASRVLLTVEDAAQCENCKGSDNRRSFRRMVRMCRERRIYRMIVVGGSPDAHAELERLTPKGFLQRIVTGKERRTKKQATEDLRHADLLAVWGPTILPHKISELYTKQKEDYPNKVVLVLKRGVASFAREVCEFLEGLD